MNYRFNPAKGIRRQGHWYGQLEDAELDSEDYDSLEDWFEAIRDYFIEIKEADEEQENDNSN